MAGGAALSGSSGGRRDRSNVLARSSHSWEAGAAPQAEKPGPAARKSQGLGSGGPKGSQNNVPAPERPQLAWGAGQGEGRLDWRVRTDT